MQGFQEVVYFLTVALFDEDLYGDHSWKSCLLVVNVVEVVEDDLVGNSQSLELTLDLVDRLAKENSDSGGSLRGEIYYTD